MKFVSATTAREMVKEYESTAKQRFLNDLNDKIIECAKKGLNECCISLREYPEQERGNLICFLTQHGFTCAYQKTAGQPMNYYKIMW
jgi:hypothetical protein